jgi:3-oxoadipate enol-lactonase
VKLAYRRTGSGSPLLVLNGFAATKDDWDPSFLEELARKRELVLIDNRGMGESPDDGEAFTIEDLAEDTEETIEALELGRVAVLGWSMGGFIALTLALTRPDVIERLVLLSTTAGGELATLADPDVRERLRDLSGAPREQASRLISLLFPPERAREIDAEFGDAVADARAALSADVVERQWAAMEEWEAHGPAKEVGRISCRVLVATGEEDVVIPPANAAALARAIPGSRRERFGGCGHGFMADHPSALARQICDFLSS